MRPFDPVIAWLESRFLVTRTRLESRWEKWWLHLTRVTFFTDWLESQTMTRDSNQSHFYKISEFLMGKSTSFAHNEISIFSMMIKIGANFLFCLSSRSALHFKEQVFPTRTEIDLRLFFHWGVSRAQYIDTLSWFNAVFAYRDHGSWPHTVTLSLFQIPVMWLSFSDWNPIQKPESCLNPNFCHWY